MSEEDFNLFLANVLASVHGADKVASLMRRPISEVYAAKLSAYYGQPVSPDFSLADVVKHVSEKLGRARTVHRQTLDGIEALRELSKTGGESLRYDAGRGAEAGGFLGATAGGMAGAGLGAATGPGGWKSRVARGIGGGLVGAVGGGTVGVGLGAHTGVGASVVDPNGSDPEWQRHAIGGGALGAALGAAGGAGLPMLGGKGWRNSMALGLGGGLAGGLVGGGGGALVGAQRQGMDRAGL